MPDAEHTQSSMIIATVSARLRFIVLESEALFFVVLILLPLSKVNIVDDNKSARLNNSDEHFC
jgi:hypothetical protein